MKNFLVPVAISAICTVALSGCHQVPQSTAASNIKPSISASGQAAGGAVVVDQISMPSTGWIVVHAVRNGTMDVSGSIGHIYVPAGPSGPHTVPLSEAVQPGDQVVAMLHLDTGNAKVYEFANGGNEANDGPVMLEDRAVMVPIDLN